MVEIILTIWFFWAVRRSNKKNEREMKEIDERYRCLRDGHEYRKKK
jgi:hypothetical protein